MFNERKMRIIACIPAYNEEKSIAKVVLLAQKFVDKVVVVDDGSEDLTGEIAKRLGAYVVRHDVRKGYGAAIQTCFKTARELGADIMVTLDADGQHDPEEIPKLIEPISNNEADIVIGSRFLNRKSISEIPLYRRLGIKTITFLTRRVTGNRKISDAQSGFRAYSRKALEELEIEETGMSVSTEILIKAAEKKLNIVEVPIFCRYKGIKSSTHHPIRHGFNVIASILNFIAIKHPLLLLGVPGIISLGFGLLLLWYVIKKYYEVKQLAIGTMMLSTTAILAGIFAMLVALLLYVMTKKNSNKINNKNS